jgi:hypothetical protein
MGFSIYEFMSGMAYNTQVNFMAAVQQFSGVKLQSNWIKSVPHLTLSGSHI